MKCPTRCFRGASTTVNRLDWVPVYHTRQEDPLFLGCKLRLTLAPLLLLIPYLLFSRQTTSPYLHNCNVQYVARTLEATTVRRIRRIEIKENVTSLKSFYGVVLFVIVKNS